jgi:putative ABC transport system permease protein
MAAFDTLSRDLRYALRGFRRQPGFAALAVLALALGTGATTAIFTVVDAVLIRPLAYRDPGRLVVAMHGPDADEPMSPADYLDYRDRSRAFEHLSAAEYRTATLEGADRPERLTGLRVTADLFDLLGVPAALGRRFRPAEDQPGQADVVVLSDGLWQRAFGGRPDIVGRTVRLDGHPYVVIGVMPPGFRFAPFWATRAEFWTPLDLSSRASDRAGRSLRIFGRLRPGVSAAQAQTDLDAIAASLARQYPEDAKTTTTVRPLLDKVVAGIRPTLLALLAMVAFVLLIACANVANALLARASGRRQEIAVRTALGASAARVVRQLLTESLLLAIAGAAAGLAVGVWGTTWLMTMLPPGSLPRQQDVGLDTQVFVIAAATAIATGLVTGLAPALQLVRTSLVSAFQDGSKGSTISRSRRRLGSVLVAAEVALAVVLLAGAGLMGRTMQKLSAVDAGFRVDGIAVATVSLAGTPAVDADRRLPTYLRVRDRLKSMPGVRAVSAINHLPIAGDLWTLGYRVDGRPMPERGRGLAAAYRVVLPDYFATMGLRIISGRPINETDDARAMPVAVINQAMADRQWPGGSAIGQRIYLPGPGRVTAPITIVGVSANARQQDWTSAPEDEVYLPFAQRASEFGLSAMTFVLATSSDPEVTAAGIARETALVDRGLAVSDASSMRQVVADALWRERVTAVLTGIFAAVALGLAAIGIYAVTTSPAAPRRRVFRRRVALGATRLDVQRLALGDALVPIAGGTAAGVGLALVLAHLMRSLLFEVDAIDPVAFGGAVAALLAAALVAAWLPAWREAR